MKKEIKTYEELLKCHLKPFEAKHNKTDVEGVVFVDTNKNIFLLQNKIEGYIPKDDDYLKCGYKYSWQIYDKHGALVSIVLYDIILDVEWQPKFGELVNAYDSESDFDCSPHIFLFEKNGVYHCVAANENAVKNFNSSNIQHEYMVFKYKFVKQIEEPKNIEISLEEAKEIIAKEKGIKAEQVNLNFKIN